jgi:hypothetical protein
LVNHRPWPNANVQRIPAELIQGMVEPAECVKARSGCISPPVDDPVAKTRGAVGGNPGLHHVMISLANSEGHETILAYNTPTTVQYGNDRTIR